MTVAMSSTRPPLSRGGTPTARGLSRAVVSAACLLAAAIAGCGSGEREFTAREFVREADAAGARLKLERRLYTNQPSKRLYGVSVGDHGGGSLAVLESPSAARQELARCRSAVTLVCYRASNVVLSLEGEESEPAERRRLAVALRRMARG
jgi:hypothetical protein